MRRMRRLFVLAGKGILRQRGNIHRFSPKIFAKGGSFHIYALSCISVRRISVRAI